MRKMKKSEERIITIKRRIDSKNKDLIRYLEDNMWYARKVYNDAVERYMKYFDEQKIILSNGGSFRKFDFMKESVKYYNDIEVNNPNYKYYCVGIRANCFLERLMIMDNIVWKSIFGKFENKKQNKNARPHFKKYNPFEGSFKVENKRSADENGWDKLDIISHDILKFKASKQQQHYITLREDLFGIKDGNKFYDNKKRYMFKQKWIKQVGFVKENNKYYIIIITKVLFLSGEIYLRNPQLKMRKAGIDLGIRNPISIYNGINSEQFKIISADVQSKIDKLLLRVKKLQVIMDRKYYGSRNYRKIQLKLRKTWRKIRHIRIWNRWNTAVKLAKSYYILIVDNFNQPDREFVPGTSNLNIYNRSQGMYLFDIVLRYVCTKYRCIYIPAPPDTTRTCSCCGHVNDRLTLSERYLECKNCGTNIDRDKNAAINCYNFDYIVG